MFETARAGGPIRARSMLWPGLVAWQFYPEAVWGPVNRLSNQTAVWPGDLSPGFFYVFGPFL